MKKLMIMAFALAQTALMMAAQPETLELYINDMHCGKCAQRIMGKLKTMEGIDTIIPHVGRHYLTIRYNSSRMQPATIRNTVTEIGYTPVSYGKTVAYAYYIIPAEAATAATVESVKSLKGVSDANVNGRRKSLAVTYQPGELTADQLLAAIQQKGIKAELPAPHECKEEGGKK